MTTFKEISDNSFSITFVTSNFNTTTSSFSERTKHRGLEWFLSVRRSESNDLACFLWCNGNSSNIWNASFNVTFQMTKKSPSDFTHSKKFSNVLTSTEPNWGFGEFMKNSELTDEYINDGKITIECIVEIKSITGLTRNRKIQFTEKDENLSDVVLVVEDKKLHVSKVLLAHASPIFRAMFYSRFQESTWFNFKRPAVEVPIKDVKYDEFVDLLQIVHHGHVDIDSKNVESLLILADRFDVEVVTQKCESFLIASQMKVEEKLKLAERFKLSILHSSCLDSIKNMSDLKKMGGVKHMGEATAKALLAKAIAFE